MTILDRLTLHGETIAIACTLLGDGRAATWPELRTRLTPFGGSDEAARELEATLRELNMVVVADTHSALSPQPAIGQDLALWMLGQLRSASGPDAAIMDLYGWLLGEEQLAGRVLERDEVWPLYNQARGGGAPLVINTPKMASWLRLMSFVGLIRPERSNSFVLVPSLELTRALLADAVAALKLNDLAALPDLVGWIEARYCPLQQHPGRLHPGFADALVVLELLGDLELVMLGDARALFAGRRQLSHLRLHGRLAA